MEEQTQKLLDLMILERDKMWTRFIRYRLFDKTIPAPVAILELRESALCLNETIKEFCSSFDHLFRNIDTAAFNSTNIEQTSIKLGVDIHTNPFEQAIKQEKLQTLENMINNAIPFIAVDQYTLKEALDDIGAFADTYNLAFDRKDFTQTCESLK